MIINPHRAEEEDHDGDDDDQYAILPLHDDHLGHHLLQAVIFRRGYWQAPLY